MTATEAALPGVALPTGESVRRQDELSLEPIPQLVATARRFVIERLDELDGETRETVALLTSELVTNVVIHARTKLRVGIVTTDTSVVVTVHDLDLGNVELDPGNREGGRGLVLVEALSEAHGVESQRDGKVAWFRVRRPDGAVHGAAGADAVAGDEAGGRP